MDKNNCYICWEEGLKNNILIPSNICSCKSLYIHHKCFLKLEDKIKCSVCKNLFQEFTIKTNNKVFEYKKYGITESYNVNKNGNRTGLFQLKNYQNMVLLHCYFKNGFRHGLFKTYYHNGNLREKGYIYNCNKVGKYVKCYENGVISSIRRYKKGLKQGMQECYNENGTLVLRQNFKKDKLNGKSELFYSNGNIKYEVYYKDGIADGRIREWNIHGDIINDFNVKDGTYADDYSTRQKILFIVIFFAIFLFFV
jgi:antitoxin component YwqK of YwqJK toxin-antitoxin module